MVLIEEIKMIVGRETSGGSRVVEERRGALKVG